MKNNLFKKLIKIFFLLVVVLNLGSSCPVKTYPFDQIPDAMADGLVVNFDKIIISGKLVDQWGNEYPIDRPYNPSILKFPKNWPRDKKFDKSSVYLLSFRQDSGYAEIQRQDHIGIIELNESFVQNSPVFALPTGNDEGRVKSEDARLFLFKNKIFVSYGEVDPAPSLDSSDLFRKVFQGEVFFDEFTDGSSGWSVKNIISLSTGWRQIEKNWMPFVTEDEILYSYSLVPHWIVRSNGQQGVSFSPNRCDRKIPWDFGSLRGGTPAILQEDGSYLGFFQSSIKNPFDNFKHYFMGAYVFEGKAPYCVIKASKWPIQFDGMYDAPTMRLPYYELDPWTAGIRVIFPGSFVEIENTSGQTEIVVSYGASDAQSNLLWINKKKLIESLQDISGN